MRWQKDLHSIPIYYQVMQMVKRPSAFSISTYFNLIPYQKKMLLKGTEKKERITNSYIYYDFKQKKKTAHTASSARLAARMEKP